MVYLYNPNSSITANMLPGLQRFQQAAVGYINPCSIKPGMTLLPPKTGRTWRPAGLLSKVTACLTEMRKPLPLIPASTHLNWSPFSRKPCSFALMSLGGLKKINHLLCLCRVTFQAMDICSVFVQQLTTSPNARLFSPSKGICKQHCIPALQKN